MPIVKVMTEEDSTLPESRDLAVKRARWKYVQPPIFAFFILMLVPLIAVPFYGDGYYSMYMPDIVFMAGIIVIFIGAWYDFGASAYIKELKDYYSKTPTEQDLAYIQKQQFIITVLYILIGLMYIGAAVLIYLLLQS